MLAGRRASSLAFDVFVEGARLAGNDWEAVGPAGNPPPRPFAGASGLDDVCIRSGGDEKTRLLPKFVRVAGGGGRLECRTPPGGGWDGAGVMRNLWVGQR